MKKLNPRLKKSIFGGVTLLYAALNANASILINEPLVKSYLGQPLTVEIPVQADTQDWDTLWGTVELNTGVPLETIWKKPYAPGTLGSIEIRTSTPVQESVIDLKIRVESMQNQAIMYYPILIDKYGINSVPVATPATSAPTATPVIKVELPTSSTPVTSTPTTSTPGIKVELPNSVTSSALYTKNSNNLTNIDSQTKSINDVATDNVTTNIKVVVVKYGDNLFKIAKTHKPDNMTTMVAMNKIYKENKSLFGGSMNMIRAGVTLTMPF